MPGGTGSCPLAAARGRGRREPLAAARPRGWPGPGSRQRRAPLRCPVLRAPGCPRCPVLCPPVSSRSPVLRPPGSPARSRRRRSGSRGGTAGEERARGGWKVPVARRGRSYPGLGGVSRFPDSPGGVIPVWMEYPGFPDSPGGVIPVWLEYPGFHEHREELSRFGWIIPVSIGTGRSYPGLLELPDDFRVYGWELSRNFPGSPGGVIPVWVEYPGFHGHREELSRFGWNIPVFQTHREELSRSGWSIPVSMSTGRSYPGLGGLSRFPSAPGGVIPVCWSFPTVSRLTGRSYPGLAGASRFPWAPGGVIPVWVEYPGFPDSPGEVFPVWPEHPGLFHAPAPAGASRFPGSPAAIIPV
ncbi:collagen alpha-2(IV) chain-like isoform X25 [Corvus hawaiiensis]|uniref:collagen alpha-2(IV) chain-like isoform X25 n=1 Tax=Corvus hawaiiensis TaxID=134902 RepID=UPI0020191336|nr:collagen alpha-2(IV) chain-like isoform X25 [Corvus hawaiiensis]